MSFVKLVRPSELKVLDIPFVETPFLLPTGPASWLSRTTIFVQACNRCSGMALVTDGT